MDARAGSAVSRKSGKASLILMKVKHPEDRERERADLQMISTESEEGSIVRKDGRNWMGRRCVRRQCLDSRPSWTAVDVMRIKTMSLHLWKHLQGAGAAIQLWHSFPISLKHPLKCRRHGFSPWVEKILAEEVTTHCCSCLESSMDRGARQATVQGATKNQTRLNTHVHETQGLERRTLPREGLNSLMDFRMTLRSYYQTYSSFRESALYNYSGWLRNYW